MSDAAGETDPDVVDVSILIRKVLRLGEFDSRDDLVARILASIEHRNQTTQPFNRVYDAKEAA